LLPVWGLFGGLSGENQYPTHADWATRIAAPQQSGGLGTACLPRLEHGVEPALAISHLLALGPSGSEAMVAGRLDAQAAGARQSLDVCPRFSRPCGTLVSGSLEGAVS